MGNEAQLIEQRLTDIKQCLARGQLEEALKLVNDATEWQRTPADSVELLYLKAVVLRYQKVFAEAQLALNSLFEIAPQHGRATQEQGHLFVAMGKSREAAKAFYHATLRNPALVGSWKALDSLYREAADPGTRQHVKDNLSYWSNLPRALNGAADLLFSGELADADRVCRQFLQQHKHHPDGLYILGLIDIQAKIYDEAEFVLQSCCTLSETHHRARAEYAGLLNRMGKYHQGLKQAETLLQSQPDDLNYQVLKGVALVGLGEVEKGLGLFSHILSVEPERASLWLQLGHAHKALGQMDAAVKAYKQALTFRHDYGDAYWSLANTKSYLFTGAELADMQSLLDKPSTGKEDRIHLAFALGKGYADAGDPTTGLQFYHRGNDEQYRQCHYSPAMFSQQVDRQIAYFTESVFKALDGRGYDDDAPIFIVGLPRAGSTLLEQILSAHSRVDATHELHDILSLVRRLRRGENYPDMLSSLNPEYLRRFGKQFIEQTQIYRQSGQHFIDKMPNNFLHLGLIKLILPNARVIDARRSPIDCCYSGYTQLFAEGQDFSYDLTAIGQYYRDYERLMDHWDKVMPGFVLRVQHEDVIEDTEQQVRRMLQFCGLEFESACLDFHRNERAVHTPSAAQVRQPINRKGIGRWRQVEDQLTPLINALAGED